MVGCYDWVQVGWNNIFDMKSKLEQYPDGVFITDQFSGPVKRDGTVIGNPPIHIHHIHVDPMNDAGDSRELIVNHKRGTKRIGC